MFENGLTRRRLISAVAGFSGVSLCSSSWAGAAAIWASAVSPDGRLAIDILEGPRWTVRFCGRQVLRPSALGFVRADGRSAVSSATLLRVSHRRETGSWRPPYGIAGLYEESFTETTVTIRDGCGVVFDIVVRACNAGAALRYILRDLPGGDALSLSGERTELYFPAGTKVYASRDEGEYSVGPIGTMAPMADPPATHDADPSGMADIPVTAILANRTVILVTESGRQNYPRMMLQATGADCLTTYAMRYPARRFGPSAETVEAPPSATFVLKANEETPWRVLMIASDPAQLIEQAGLIPTLAGKCVLRDTSWIKPGKAIRIRLPYTTERALKVVAFARAHKLDYIEFDWHWYGNGTDDSDATVPIAGLDIRRVIDNANAVGIGTILYVDRAPAAKQLDAIVQTYESWGVAGIKFGFLWEGGQCDNAAIVKAVQACGEHRLLADLHDDLRPAGLERIYPNCINLEGVRGNEHFPTARHNVTLPFTRNLAGPIDYTICYANPKNRTTNAHQLAMAAVYYSPLNFLYWYDEPEKYETGDWAALKWFDEIPTAWDETRCLAGRIGEYVAVARRRSDRWFLGVMTDENARVLSLPLSFLGGGRWLATIYADGAPTEPAYKTEVVVSKRFADSNTVLQVRMNGGGGQAVSFEPMSEKI